jgi:hypothetical protein
VVEFAPHPKIPSDKKIADDVGPPKEAQEMQVDSRRLHSPDEVPDKIPERVELVNQPEKETKPVEEPVVEEIVENVSTSMTGVEEDGPSKSTSCGGHTPEIKKMTMDERKIKFNELRKKVCVVVRYAFCLGSFSFHRLIVKIKRAIDETCGNQHLRQMRGLCLFHYIVYIGLLPCHSSYSGLGYLA